MRHYCSLLAAVGLLTTAVAARADTPDLIPRVEKQLQQGGSRDRALALGEMHRVRGQQQQALAVLRTQAARLSSAEGAALLEYACWQMLPLGEARVAEFRRDLDVLARLAPQSPWLGIYRLVLAAAERDPQALLAAADKVSPPPLFPNRAAETAHRTTLMAVGVPRNSAALEVIRHRIYEPLFALRDLDRELSSAVEACRLQGRDADAARLLAAHDRLRKAWLTASQHVVERLFALRLAGRDDEAEKLLRRAQAIPFVNDVRVLERRLAGLSSDAAWTSLLQPLWESEVAAIDLCQPDTAAPTAELVVRAKLKRQADGASLYEGPVDLRLGRVAIACNRLTLETGSGSRSMNLQGTGGVRLTGLPAFDHGLAAERFAYDGQLGHFTLEGDVRTGDAAYATACTITLSGRLVGRRTLFDDFAEAKDDAARQTLVPKITDRYGDDELPSAVKYAVAMKLLRPQLSWHAHYPPPDKPDSAIEKLLAQEQMIEHDGGDGRWAEAHPGEAWMQADAPRARLQKERERLLAARNERRAKANPTVKHDLRAVSDDFSLMWRLKDRRHADVQRAIKLLSAVNDGELGQRARHWREELERNNTVVTLDVPGALPAGGDAPVVVDVRNAERLKVRLYRVSGPAEMLGVHSRIGEDFLYVDYGLQYEGRAQHAHRIHEMAKMAEMCAQRRQIDMPALSPKNLVRQWDVDIDQLEPLDLDREGRDGWDEEDDEDKDRDDAEYFGDRCEQYRARLTKRYWPGWGRDSSWQCDRLVKVPAAALKQPGAYLVAIEANGQTAYAPLLVEPLSLVLRRCRDGVFTLVAAPEGTPAVGGATVHAVGMKAAETTNADGVAFARVFAAGDVAILAEKNGRWGVGGFGRVFRGIYHLEDEREYRLRVNRVLRERRKVAIADAVAHVYEDQYILAGFTDRPVYRPGQEVNFKLIVRRLPLKAGSAQTVGNAAASREEFRAGDFDWEDRMTIPSPETMLRYELVDPAGRAVAAGDATLNDFGTAVGKATLSTEARTGAYTIRVYLDGKDHLVPEAFAVKYYRRPNFELAIVAAPEELKAGEPLPVKLSGRYYFGKPVAGWARVQLFAERGHEPLGDVNGQLDARGELEIALMAPQDLAPGEYRLLGTLTDLSGRAVTCARTCRVAGQKLDAAAATLATLPQFIAANETVTVKTDEPVVAVDGNNDREVRLTFRPRDGVAKLTLSAPGWWRLALAGKEREIFVYGGIDEPRNLPEAPQTEDSRTAPVPPRWVNLADYAAEDDKEERAEPTAAAEAARLLALFDKHEARVGEKLRLLVYAPAGGPLLLTLEGRTIIDYIVCHESDSGPYRVVEIPIKRRYLPNFYVQGRSLPVGALVAARAEKPIEKLQKLADMADEKECDGEDPRWCRVDVIDPAAAKDGQRLRVELQPDAEEYRPGDKATVRITTTDLAGKPCETEIALAAVDESVFSFGADRVDGLAALFADPHPPRRFLPKAWRASAGSGQAVNIQRAMAKLAAQQKMLQEASAMLDAAQRLETAGPLTALERNVPVALLAGQRPAASFETARLRRDFRETAAWLPQLRTDPNGVAEANFTLPDSLTRYRLTGVGLSRGAEIGVGRAAVRVALPLSAQLMLPRFAVENDHLQAVALLHNHTAAARRCRVAWRVEGAHVAPPTERDAYRVMADGATVVAEDHVAVEPGKTVAATLPLVFDRVGVVKVQFRTGDDADGDAEDRSLVVQPLGRPREVLDNGPFRGRHELKLPAGFVVRDLQLSIARADVAGAMGGLGYLVDYPYGCVEQTMSRFLPAVMVKRAMQQSAVALPPEVAAKLPDVLEKGLQRLYGFQQPDGSWGWFQQDARNDAMTIYVVYGLARCRNTGTPVDEAVLGRGCEYLLTGLAGDKMAADHRPAAWLALALAGKHDTARLRAEAEKMLEQARAGNPASMAYLALACKQAGLHTRADQLAGRAATWQPDATQDIALKLTLQIAFARPLEACRETAQRLLDRRVGHYWGDTRSTAWAIEALSQMLRYDTTPSKATRIAAWLGDKPLLDVTDAKELQSPAHHVHLRDRELPADEGLKLTLLVEGEPGARFALTAAGTQRLEHWTGQGDRVKLERHTTRLDGKPLAKSLRQGDVAAVRLKLELAEPQSYLIIEEPRPAGCEFADEHLDGAAAARAVNVEFRDDRLCAFFTHLPAGTHELVYYLRAETRGTCHILPGAAYPMYAPQLRGETAVGNLKVE